MTTTPADQLPYSEALAELESILSALESSSIDVDTLATSVARATELLAHCRRRLDTVRKSVSAVLEDASTDATDPDDVNGEIFDSSDDE